MNYRYIYLIFIVSISSAMVGADRKCAPIKKIAPSAQQTATMSATAAPTISQLRFNDAPNFSYNSLNTPPAPSRRLRPALKSAADIQAYKQQPQNPPHFSDADIDDLVFNYVVSPQSNKKPATATAIALQPVVYHLPAAVLAAAAPAPMSQPQPPAQQPIHPATPATPTVHQAPAPASVSVSTVALQNLNQSQAFNDVDTKGNLIYTDPATRPADFAASTPAPASAISARTLTLYSMNPAAAAAATPSRSRESAIAYAPNKYYLVEVASPHSPATTQSQASPAPNTLPTQFSVSQRPLTHQERFAAHAAMYNTSAARPDRPHSNQPATASAVPANPRNGDQTRRIAFNRSMYHEVGSFAAPRRQPEVDSFAAPRHQPAPEPSCSSKAWACLTALFCSSCCK